MIGLGSTLPGRGEGQTVWWHRFSLAHLAIDPPRHGSGVDGESGVLRAAASAPLAYYSLDIVEWLTL